MQMDKWPISKNAQQGNPDGYASFSVWIDPVVQQHISASYLTQDKPFHKGQEENPKVPNPTTPIPARASANPPGVVKVRPRYPRLYALPEDSDITRIPTMPQPPMWQYESPDYNVESSLSSLSLVVPEVASKQSERRYAVSDLPLDELDTLPPPPQRPKKRVLPAVLSRKAPHKGPIHGVPIVVPPFMAPSSASSRDVSEIDTHPEKQQEVQRAPQAAVSRASKRIEVGTPFMAPAASPLPTARNVSLVAHEKAAPSLSHVQSSVTVGAPFMAPLANSWTVGRGANSVYAKRIAGNERFVRRKSIPSLNPVDKMRWWLLYPGRIEFLLWFGGAITLMSVTCIFLFVTIVSFGWVSPDWRTSGTGGPFAQATTGTNTDTTSSASCAGKKLCAPAQSQPSPHLALTLLTNSLLVPGMEIRIAGKDFTANKQVSCTHDNGAPCSLASWPADASGAFVAPIQIGFDWKPGPHVIYAYDTASKRFQEVTIAVAPVPFGKSAATPTVTALPPGVTPTTPIGGQGPLPTPVGRYPVTVTPGPSPIVTPTQSVPTATPTQGNKPTPTPTVKVKPSPTARVSPTVGTTATPTKSHVLPSQITSLKEGSTYSSLHLSSSLWLWLVLIGYALAMLMLGIAGILHQRSRSRL